MAFVNSENTDLGTLRKEHWISVGITLAIAVATWIFAGFEAMAGISLLFLVYQTCANGVGGLERDFLARARYQDLRKRIDVLEESLERAPQ